MLGSSFTTAAVADDDESSKAAVADQHLCQGRQALQGIDRKLKLLQKQ